MSIVTTIFGESININDAIELHNGGYANDWNFLHESNSRDYKEIVVSFVWSVSEDAFVRCYARKTDAVRIHRSPLGGNTYLVKSSIPFAQTINYQGKDYYFLTDKDRFDSGYAWSMDEFRWIDLKVRDKNMWGNLRLVRTNEEMYKFVYIRGGSFDSQSRIASGQHIKMAQVPSHNLGIYYEESHRDVVLDAWNGFKTIRTSANKFVTDWDGLSVVFYISSSSMWRFNRQEVYTLQLGDNGEEVNRIFNPTEVNGIRYFDRESAVANGYQEVFCHHCRRDVGTDHDTEDCARRNFRNDRFGYHSGPSVKSITMPMRMVFKIGVEIEKQTRLGAIHNHEQIMNQFGWRKERDGSLDDTIGYELVSPCYPLFTDDLINEAKAMEARFPNLINSNEQRRDADETARFHRSCGGHIHFSRAFTSGQDTFEMVSGYMPLLYSIYKKRINISYCEAKEKNRMKNSTTKYQAVKIMDDRIEFRIFPLVEGIKTLEWRINLLRIMANNPTNSFIEVVNMLCDSSSDLHQHMLKIFPLDKLKRRISQSLDMATMYDRDYSSYDFTSVRSIIRSL
jgi:hypothetical protein